MKRIIVIGSGFGGLWAAIGAAKKRHELSLSPNELEIYSLIKHPITIFVFVIMKRI